MNTPRKKVAWSHWDRVLIGVIGVVVVLAVSGWLWSRALDTNPIIQIPTPTMPAPNAYDYYVAAGNAVVDSTKINYAISTSHTPPPAGNAPTVVPDPDHPYSLTEKEALVAENAVPLQTVRQGFAYPCQNPPVRSLGTLFPEDAKIRGVARLLKLEGDVKAGHGDWGGAINSDLDAVRLGEDTPHGGLLIAALVGYACDAIGRRPVWARVNSLNAAQAKAAARRLEQLQARHFAYADTLQEEKWSTQANLLEIMDDPHWRQAATGPADAGLQAPLSWRQRMQLAIISKRAVMANYTSYMDQLISNARQSYAARPAPPPLPDDPVNQIIILNASTVSAVQIKDVDNETQNALLTVMLALRAYKLAHGAYPATLNALVPTYLAKLPDDPFALSGPLRYKRTGTSYVLYSVGPDGKDDGGKPIFDASKQAPTAPGMYDRRYEVDDNSKGDIVAGVNIF